MLVSLTLKRLTYKLKNTRLLFNTGFVFPIFSNRVNLKGSKFNSRKTIFVSVSFIPIVPGGVVPKSCILHTIVVDH